ncbi:uncharacterized protein BJ212DRAFT_1482273 [Suillus subaureus]|uniref:Uncharacterized protein n=1 Tax=Suillus subaureus TaxID=48587 RepID=A0A9P7JC63_9AGAM|nr:uncharacterized protein BJ212DRAFT_1482273 [Suillus subaureus]KAG1813924.1 hypothetical protein BJ212DRAFT_1482273 [Suillus subaureus]
MTKVIQKTLTNKAKGTWVHTPAEIFSTIAYKEEVKEQVQDAIKSGKLVTKQEKFALQECTAPIVQFLQVIKDMSGWEWTVIGAGPDPHLGGQLNVMSYHTGVNGDGHNWKQATPKFIEKHLNPYLEFVGTLFHEKSRAMDVITPLTNSLSPMTSLANSLPPTISSPLGEGSGSLEGASSTVTPASHGTALHAPLTLSDTLQGVDLSQMQTLSDTL